MMVHADSLSSASAPLPLMKVLERNAEWSDHALLELELMPPCSGTALVIPPGPSQTVRQRMHRAVSQMTSDGPLDQLLCEALKAAERPRDEIIREVYGDVCEASPRVDVWTDGSALGRAPDRRAGAAAVFGVNARCNALARLPGPEAEQVNNRAELYALLLAVRAVAPMTTLKVYTDSEYVIRTLCYRIGAIVQANYGVPNSDLIRAIVLHVRARRAALILEWVKAHAGVGLNELADILAKRAAAMPARPMEPHLLVPPPDWSDTDTNGRTGCTVPGHWLKVHTAFLPGAPHDGHAPVQLPSASVARQRDIHDDSVTGASGSDHVLPYESGTLAAARRSVYERLCSGSHRDFWKTFHEYMSPRRSNPTVTAEQLREVFEPRMNPLPTQPMAPPADMRLYDSFLAATMPSTTPDPTPEQYFSRPFTAEEVSAVKTHLQDAVSTARGNDGLSYADIMRMPNDRLCDLFNECVRTCDAPEIWLTSILAAAPKKGKGGSDPAGYRNIGLESCLLKTLTFLIERRLRDWAQKNDLIPPHQNGFRAAHRTENNVFTLRVAIDKARADGRTLWVAYVDLANAFPSVDHAVLWTKLADRGASGPLIDWMRMIYRRMQYYVRYGGDASDFFKSLAGILIGTL